MLSLKDVRTTVAMTMKMHALYPRIVYTIIRSTYMYVYCIGHRHIEMGGIFLSPHIRQNDTRVNLAQKGHVRTFIV